MDCLSSVVLRATVGEADAIYEVERQKAKERMGEGGRSGKFSEPSAETRDEVADRIGIGSGRTYGKAKKVRYDEYVDGLTGNYQPDELQVPTRDHRRRSG